MGWKHKLQHPSVLLMGRGGGAGGGGVCGRSKHPHPSPQLPVEGEAPQAQVHPIRAACNKTEREGGVELGLKSPASREAGHRGAAWTSVACFRCLAQSTPTDTWVLRPLNEVALGLIATVLGTG